MAFDLVAAYAESETPFFVKDSLTATATLKEATRELTLRFSPGVTLNASTLSAIRVVRSGGDGDFTSFVDVTPTGSVGCVLVDDTPNGNQAIVRFAETLPNDIYEIRIGSGLRSVTGDTATPTTVPLRLDLGAQVVAVIPQPVTRSGGGLVQSRDTIEVYFTDTDPLKQSSAENVNFYRLVQVDASGNDVGGSVLTPTSAAYSAIDNRAVLTFAPNAILDGRTYRLDIGATTVTAATVVAEGSDDNSSFTTARSLGTLTANGMTIAGAISTRPTVTTPVGVTGFPSQPGTLDEPGHRSTPVDSGNHGAPAFVEVDPATGIRTANYNFRPVIGADPQGNPLPNVITEAQKQRAREIFELFSRYTGIRFVETASSGYMVATGDLRAFDPNTSVTGVAGLGGSGGALMNGLLDWGQSEFGGRWFQVAMHEIGHAIGLEHSYDLPSIMGNTLPGDGVYPGDYDIVHLLQLYPKSGSDIDLYKFTVSAPGRLSAETVIARPGQPVTSTLDSVLTLYREETINGRTVRTMVARNDDYFGRDSFVGLDLAAGDYFIAVSSTGNTNFDPTVSDSGMGGRSQGNYSLRLGFVPASADTNTVLDATDTPIDGDRDGLPGGVFRFWFRTAAEADTIFVDKANAAVGNGSRANPFKTIAAALAAVQPSTRVIRIAGNAAGPGGTPLPYLIGTTLANGTLEDGRTFNVPAGVTVMIDAGAVLKIRAATIDVGSSSAIPSDSRAGAAIQVLGTPSANVTFTSYHDDDIGGNSDGLAVPRDRWTGSWGGIVLREDSDEVSRRAFVNSISQATFKYGGGQVLVDSVLESIAPIQIENTRPTVAFNLIRNSAGAALAATPDSFEETAERVGPELRGNRFGVGTESNSVNGVFIKIDQESGVPLNRLTVPARFKSDDIVYVLQENLVISGGVGGYINQGIGTEARKSGRLAVDPGVVVKVQGSRIELERGTAQFIAEGRPSNRVIFTSLADNRFGAGGTFDTNGNVPDKFTSSGEAILPLTVGDWGGIIVNAGSRASIDQAYIAFGGGLTAIEGRYERFNVIEVHQGDLRLANSRIERNDAGSASSTRNGRGGNTSATVFVRGAQPIIVRNDFRQNAGAIVSVNANALSDAEVPDTGRSTGPISRFAEYDDNSGPLIAGNRMAYSSGSNAIVGLVVRGEEITVESVWDDTDIVHVLQNEIIVQNFHTATGLRLESRPEASLVVKLLGASAGFTAAGYGLDINDRIGGTVQVVGLPARPVILTSLRDDSVGAGLDPLGVTVKDTNNDGSGTVAAPGDWRSLQFLPLSNDRNVAIFIENERSVTGGIDVNNLTTTAEWLGVLAPNFATAGNSWESAQEKSGDEVRRLGFEVHGAIAHDAPGDVDVYSFTGSAGSEVWIDLDRTSSRLDSMVELLDSSGNVLARSGDSTVEGVVVQGEQVVDAVGGTSVTYQLANGGIQAGTLSGVIVDTDNGVLVQSFAVSATGVFTFQNLSNDVGHLGIHPHMATGGTVDLVNGRVTLAFAGGGIGETFVQFRYSYRSDSLGVADGAAGVLAKDASLGGDHYTVNPKDAGFRIVLPGPQGAQSQYFVRVRSQPRYEPVTTGPDNGSVTATSSTQYRSDVASSALVAAGATSGRYELQVRLRQRDEKAGSTVRQADIRYPTIGIDVLGLPRNSLLAGETGESTAANDSLATAQYVGNVLQSDLNTISIAGQISGVGDVDWYAFAVNYEQIQAIAGINDSGQTWAGVFDIDYGSGFRGDLTLSVFDETGRLIFVGRDSDVRADQPGSAGTDFDDVTRGSIGKLDPFIGSVNLPAGTPTGSGGIEDGTDPVPPDPSRQLRYFVAVSSTERLPQVLNATFSASPLNPLVRLEPISSVRRLVEDHIGFQGYASVSDDGLAQIDPVVPLIDTLNLSTHVTPFTLSDVTLFVTTGSSLSTVDAMRGGVETTIQGNYGGAATIGDIVMRSDGKLYAYAGVTNDPTTAGRLDLVDSGTGARSTLGDDQIADPRTVTRTNIQAREQFGYVTTTTYQLPDTRLQLPPDAPVTGTVRFENAQGAGWWSFTSSDTGLIEFEVISVTGPVPEPVSGVLDSLRGIVSVTWSELTWTGNTLVLQEITYTVSDQSLATDQVDAIAWQRTGVGTYNNLYYSVRDVVASPDNSRLYRADPATGSAALVTGQPWGRVGSYIRNTGNTLGVVTGMAFVGNTLYGVDTLGNFFSINTSTAVATVIATFAGVNFQGLALGPQNLENGSFANLLFSIDVGGTLRAFTTGGVLRAVFDSNNDGVGDATARASGIANATGLAFSPLDVNLWHPTTRRGSDAGHGVNEASDGTRANDFSRSIIDGFGNSRVLSDRAGGASMYFGLENYSSSALTPYFNYDASRAQYGVLTNAWQADLTSNEDIRDNYNLPGGAYGSLTTNAFSLQGYSYTDKPTLYFNYFLETQNASSTTNGMRDSARVFVQVDGGAWELVATNNSAISTAGTADAELPAFRSVSQLISAQPNQHVQELFDNTGGWRQARIDLGPYAGGASVRLRFDFSTAGEFDASNNIDGLAGTTGDFGSAQRGQDNAYEGFYVDDIIVGFAERGEMVTGATAGQTAFFAINTPTDGSVPTQVVQGPYQLEIRRGTDYLLDGAIAQVFDTNDDLVVRNSTGTFFGPQRGDQNQPRQQGQFIIENNIISNTSTYGISIDAGSRDAGGSLPRPGVVGNLPTANSDRLVPGAVVFNNVIAAAGTAGLRFSGDPSTTPGPAAAVPFGRIVNNTFYGGSSPRGVGVDITENAASTLMNNVFANLATGVRVDASSASGGRTVIGTSAYWNTTTQLSGASQSDAITLGTNPFVNAAAGNFYPAAGSRVIDSSRDSLGDRPAYVAVKSDIGMPQSPILSPNRDLYGQLRSDDPGVTNLSGLGANAYKDRGAIDRVDFADPFASLLNPLDGGSNDQDSQPDSVVVRAGTVSQQRFELQLNDNGVGIDQSTVTSAAFTVTYNATPLVEGTHYAFRYLESSNRVVFESASVFATGRYVIRVNQTSGVNMIADLAGNPLLANKLDGTTSFDIALIDVPGAPGKPTGTPGDTQVALMWAAPGSDGGATISDYIVEFKLNTQPDSAFTAFADGLSSSTAATVTGLTNGLRYVFRVRARNVVGDGLWSPVSDVVPAGIVPGVPTGLGLVSRASGQVVVGWTAPIVLGDPALVDYVVEYKRSVDPDSSYVAFNDGVSDATTATVTELVDGVAYDVRVKGRSSLGDGAYSTPTTVMPGVLPGEPTGLALVSRASGQVVVGWTAPVVLGSPALTDYVVEYKRSVDPDSSYAAFNDGISTATTATVTGLTDGVSYDVRVKARNVVGDSSYATPTTVMPGLLPGVPTGLGVVSRASGQVVVAWTAPVVLGSPVLTDYVVEYKRSTDPDTSYQVFADGVSTSTTATVTGLTDGVAYLIRVKSRNLPGDSGYVTLAAPVIPGTPPGVPTGLSLVSLASGQIVVAWTAPVVLGSPALTDYVVEFKRSTDPDTSYQVFADGISTLTTATVTGLTDGVAYLVRVKARNAQGDGGYVTLLVPVVPGVLPGAPINLAGIPDVFGRTVALTWTAPVNLGSPALTDYVVEYRRSDQPDSAYTVVADGVRTTTGATVTGLSLGVTYVFRTKAVNILGEGSYSLPATVAVPTTVPAAPTSLSVLSVASGSASLGWLAPTDDGGAAITGYRVEYKVTGLADSAYVRFGEVSSPAATVTGLSNGTSYTFRVAAINGNGFGPFAVSTAVTPWPQAAAPTRLTGTASNGTVSLAWTAPRLVAGQQILDYLIQYRLYTNGVAGNWTTVSDGVSTSARATVAMANGSTYDFRVAAITTGNVVGVFSAASLRLTPFSRTALPAAPQALTPSRTNLSSTVSLAFTPPPANAGGPATSYVIQYRLTTTASWTTITYTPTNPNAPSPWTFSRLLAGRSYMFRIAARNLAGLGAYSSEVMA